MSLVKPRAGFDWNRVRWAKRDEPRTRLCSYCGGEMDEDDVPLIMWRFDRQEAQFCPACQRKWWGVENVNHFDGEPDELEWHDYDPDC